MSERVTLHTKQIHQMLQTTAIYRKTTNTDRMKQYTMNSGRSREVHWVRTNPLWPDQGKGKSRALV